MKYQNEKDVLLYLNELFQKNPIGLFAKTENLNRGWPSPFKKVVSLENQIVEGNFRMIETYMPEILLVFSLASTETMSINANIELLSEHYIPYQNLEYSRVYLQHKVISLLEVLLLADIFNNVWNGELKNYFTCETSLGWKNYHRLQIRKLIMNMLEDIYIVSISKIVERQAGVSLMFKIRESLFN